MGLNEETIIARVVCTTGLNCRQQAWGKAEDHHLGQKQGSIQAKNILTKHEYDDRAQQKQRRKEKGEISLTLKKEKEKKKKSKGVNQIRGWV